jgi:predicted nuclease of predicted toxin-antitoxin system
MGVSMSTLNSLREAGEDISHLREQSLLTLPDDQILAKAIQEGRVILTFDLDFADLLAASGGKVPSVILFRMRNQTPAAVTPRLFHALELCREALDAGAIVIVEDAAYRLRRLPIRQS